jgi:hypothetical protein
MTLRTMFVIYVAGVVSGLAYFIALGLRHA